MKRIESVRKSLENKGFSGALADWDVRVNVKHSDSGHEAFKKFVSAIKRKLKFQSIDDLQTALEKVNFGHHKISVQVLDVNKEYPVELLAACTKQTEESTIQAIPLQVEYIRHEDGILGYSLVKEDIKKRYHNGKWKLKRGSGLTIFDLRTLVAETFAFNSLEKFAEENKELLQYELIKTHLIERDILKPVKIPMDEHCKKIWKKNLSLLDYDGPVIESEELNKFNAYFRTGDMVADSFMLRFVTKIFLKEMNYIREKVKSIMNQATSYARACDTKKHINQEVLRVMKNNKFLSTFGQVELDNDVDLTKFALLEKEFESLQQILYIPVVQDHAFRIRKLGKHRAAGLYYSFQKCLVLDLDHPDAFLHELGHLLDNVLGENSLLSETINFRPVIDAYTRAMKECIQNLDENHPFRIQWLGSTKYNADYYLLPTEIFARSYELYFHSKGVTTSLMKSDYNDFCYPKQEEYIRLVTLYFNNLFSCLSDRPILEEINNVNLLNHEDIYTGSEIEQLLLF